MINKIKEIISFLLERRVTIVVVITIVLWLIYVVFFQETTEQKINKIINQLDNERQQLIDVKQNENKSYTNQIDLYNKRIQELELKIKNNKSCIELNQNNKWTIENVWCVSKIEIIQQASASDVFLEELPVYKSASTQEKLPYPFPYWRTNSNWFAQEYIHLIGNSPDERESDLLSKYWLSPDIWADVSTRYKIKTWVLACIAKADSSLWQQLKTDFNYGNVWNNDRWDRIYFKNEQQWVEAIGKVLNNRYLWNIYTIWYLSWWGRANVWAKPCTDSNEYCYATSMDNWNVNVLNCLSTIYWEKIDESFEFRIN